MKNALTGAGAFACCQPSHHCVNPLQPIVHYRLHSLYPSHSPPCSSLSGRLHPSAVANCPPSCKPPPRSCQRSTWIAHRSSCSPSTQAKPAYQESPPCEAALGQPSHEGRSALLHPLTHPLFPPHQQPPLSPSFAITSQCPLPYTIALTLAVGAPHDSTLPHTHSATTLHLTLHGTP